MPITASGVAYFTVGGLILYSGIKGSSLTHTAQAALRGNLSSLPNDEPVTFGGSSGTPVPNTVTPVASGSSKSSNTATQNQALAKAIIQGNSAYAGWDSGQNWTDLVSLWNKESSWSATAKNPSSGAYGIPQALPASKMPTAAQEPESDPSSQITWGLAYIKGQYGSPVMAWAHETANNWY